MMISMLNISKLLPYTLVSCFGNEGRHRTEETSTQTSKRLTNVNEEYKETLRTKSYIDICNQAEQQLRTSVNLDEEQPNSPSSSSSSTSSLRVHLLIEPNQETLLSISGKSKYHEFLDNYFDISQEAGRICKSILQNLHQVRLNYHTIKNVVKLIEKSPDYTTWSRNQYKWIFKDLASFSLRTNPFSKMTPNKFNDLRDSHMEFLHQLRSRCKKTKTRKKIITWIINKATRKQQPKDDEIEEEVDIAARGVYALIKDFETVSLLVKILRDEMEHNRCVAERCVAEINRDTRKDMIVLQQVTMEFKMRDYCCFQQHLQDLEQQIYLSLLDITRSRKRLLEELHKYDCLYMKNL